MFQLAEVIVSRDMYDEMLERLQRDREWRQEQDEKLRDWQETQETKRQDREASRSRTMFLWQVLIFGGLVTVALVAGQIVAALIQRGLLFP